MAWAALLIGFVTGVAILVGTITARRPSFRLRPPLRRRERAAVVIDRSRLRAFSELSDELILQVRVASHLDSTAAHNDDFDETLAEFRRASEAFLELAGETRKLAEAHHKNGASTTSQ